MVPSLMQELGVVSAIKGIVNLLQLFLALLTDWSIFPTGSPSTLSNGTAVMSMQEILDAFSAK